MNDSNYISDEELNALLDEQLDTRERDRVLDAINQDSSVNQRMNELRQLRDMVQHAYMHPPRRANADSVSQLSGMQRSGWAIAACILLCLGVVVGWFGHQGLNTNGTEFVAQTSLKEKNVILHLTSDDPERIIATLDRAEVVLSSYKVNGRDLSVEIIANETGLNLMRHNASGYLQRIQSLTNKYDNVRFLACAKAIQRLQKEGVDVELLPEVEIAPSALEQIIQRMQDDWQYIKA